MEPWQESAAHFLRHETRTIKHLLARKIHERRKEKPCGKT